MTAILAGCPRLGGQPPPGPFSKRRSHRRPRSLVRHGATVAIARPETLLARAITRAASKQTYLTISLLVERPLRHQAFCAYAYFRWVDDVLDAGDGIPSAESRIARCAFLERQQTLAALCLRGEFPTDVSRHEALLVDLLRLDTGDRDSLARYVRDMMQVMEFDVRRRGTVVSADDLGRYTTWLATAVTEAMRCFLASGCEDDDERRYLAATGAHILHMLRDTYADLGAGYFNVPREVLEANGIGPSQVCSDAYRTWVRDRVQAARGCLEDGRAYFRRAESWRYRVAGLAYIARFAWLTDQIEKDGFTIRPTYGNPSSLATGVNVGWQALGRHPRGGEQMAW